MRAIVLKGIREWLYDTVAQPHPEPGEVLVQLRAAALNHRDYWIYSGQYAGLKYPVIPGSDGAGVVADVGEGVDPGWVGREVIINPSLHWGKDPRAPEPRFQILGLPKDGTFAEYIHVPVEQVARKPAHLSWEEAAALPLAGLTAYRALFTRARLDAHEKVLITGIGAGTALFALQFAVAAGALPCVTSSSEDKLRRAHELGARAGHLYTVSDWAHKFGEHHGPFDVIVDSGGGKRFLELLDLVSNGGRIVFFGATGGNPPEFPTRKAFWKQIDLLGTTMGSPTDFQDMLSFVDRHAIHPVVHEVLSLDHFDHALKAMETGSQFGKIVLRISEDPIPVD